MEDFARSVISHDSNSVRSKLQRLHYLIVPESKAGGILEEKGVMAMLAKGIMVSNDLYNFSDIQLQQESEIRTSMDFRHSITVRFPNNSDFRCRLKSKLKKSKPNLNWDLLHSVFLDKYGTVCLISKL